MSVALVQTLQAQGVHFRLEGQQVRVNAPAHLVTPELRDTLARCKPFILEQLQLTASPPPSDEAWQERAAIIEHEAGIPREWAEAFARVCCMARPTSIPAASWQRVIDHAGRMLDSPSLLHDLVRHGWGLADVFSVHPYTPESRQDAKGLLMLMQDAEVISVINGQVIGLKNQDSGAQLFYRKPVSRTPGSVMIWEMT
jgi:hypothetical protein